MSAELRFPIERGNTVANEVAALVEAQVRAAELTVLREALDRVCAVSVMSMEQVRMVIRKLMEERAL